MSFKEICLAAYYWGAFAATWAPVHFNRSGEHTRRRWLERHLVESARLANVNR